MNPDCRAGKHAACSGDAWDFGADRPMPCGCDCHGTAGPVEPCGCVEVGPLLVAPGTSGRSWKCGECGRVWSPS